MEKESAGKLKFVNRVKTTEIVKILSKPFAGHQTNEKLLARRIVKSVSKVVDSYTEFGSVEKILEENLLDEIIIDCGYAKCVIDKIAFGTFIPASAVLDGIAEVRRVNIDVLHKYKESMNWTTVPAYDFIDPMLRHAMKLEVDGLGGCDHENGVLHISAVCFYVMSLIVIGTNFKQKGLKDEKL